MKHGLAISEVAEETGIAAGTIRAWEQRYGFPEPQRTPSGYRRYSEDDVLVLRRVLTLREAGLGVAAALERAREAGQGASHPSIFGAIAASGMPVVPQQLRKRTLTALSKAIEDEAMARGSDPVVVGAFQNEANYRIVEHRYRHLAQTAEAVVVFADFPEVRNRPCAPVEVPITAEDAMGNEWAVVVDAPGYTACLLAWEHPRSAGEALATSDADRRFETVWTMDGATVRRAALAASALAARTDKAVGARLEAILRERPVAADPSSPGLTALTNRMIAYLED